MMLDSEENFTSKSSGVTENPQDLVSDALSEKQYGNTHVLYHKKYCIMTMTTDCYRALEEERICNYRTYPSC